jgi:hypothetical protein
VQDLIDKGVVVRSYSQYASPAFLVPKPNGGHWMVVDYRLLNKKVVFDAFPVPTVEHAFAHFSGAKIFSVLDLYSAYYKIPVSAKSRKTTAFCTPFGLFEFTKFPMAISVGCQVLSRVVDSLFGDLKHKFAYNFMDDFIMYSSSYTEHLENLKIPDFSKEFTLVCDASDVAISAVLHQNAGKDLAPIAYSSRLLFPAERR